MSATDPSRSITLPGGLKVAETVFSPNARLARHHHDAPSLSYVLSGGYDEHVDRAQHSCTTGTLLYKPGQIEHSNRISAGGLRAIFIEAEQPNQILGHEWRPSKRVAELRNARSRTLIRHVVREMTNRHPGYELALEGLVLELMSEARPGATPRIGQRWLSRVTSFLEERFATDVTLELVARHVGVHPVHLAQAFRERYGRTVGDTLREIRLLRVRNELLGTLTPVSTIAHATGFADQSHMTRLFRAKFGVTPAAFRRAVRQP